jgi:hypothetical protein
MSEMKSPSTRSSAGNCAWAAWWTPRYSAQRASPRLIPSVLSPAQPVSTEGRPLLTFAISQQTIGFERHRSPGRRLAKVI